MISSLIFRTATRYLVPMILLFAIFVFLRGHNEPGGGFVGGLLAAAPFILYIFAFGIDDARRLLYVDPRSLVGFGLLIAFASIFVWAILQNSLRRPNLGGWVSDSLEILLRQSYRKFLQPGW